MNPIIRTGTGMLALLALAGCGGPDEPASQAPRRVAGTALVVRDTLLGRGVPAPGAVAPWLSADLSTRLMGKVLTVSVQEGVRVRAGEVLATLDAADLAARSGAAASGVEAAKAQLALAELSVRRLQAMRRDSAVAPVALDQAEAELERARAGLAQAQAQVRELAAVSGYARLSAPFPGVVTARLADPGDLAAPGMPLLRVEDPSRLRLSATAASAATAGVAPGMRLRAVIAGREVEAVVEGVVPAGSGDLQVVNALVENPRDSLPARASGVLELPGSREPARLVPERAVSREGDLAGVWVRTARGDDRRWIRLGRRFGDRVEVLSGLRAGDTLVVSAGKGE